MRNIIIVLVLVLAVRWVAIGLSTNYQPQGDAAEYDKIAVNCIAGNGYLLGGYPNTVRPPFYVFFLSLVYLIFGHSYTAVRVIQSLFDALTVFLIFLFMKKEAGERPALTSAVLIGFHPHYMLRSLVTMTETLSALLNVIFVLLLIKAEKDKKSPLYFLAGILLGLSILTRPILLLFPFFYLICYLIFYCQPYRWKKFTLRWTLLTVTAFALISPWTLRNYVVFRQFIPVTGYGVGMHIYSASLNYQRTEIGKDGQFREILSSTRQRWVAKGQLEAEKKLIKAGIRRIKSHPFLFLSSGFFYAIPKLFIINYLLETGGMTFLSSVSVISGKPIIEPSWYRLFRIPFRILYILIFLAGLVGFYILRKSEPFRPIILVLVYAIIMLAFFTIASSRYFLPFMPLFLALGVAGCWQLFQRKKTNSVI